MTDSIAKQIYDAVVTVIQALSLANLESTEIVLRKVPRDRNQLFRGITVSPAFTAELTGTNASDDWGYGILITFATGTGNGYSEDIDRMTLWRENVRKAFHNKRLSTIAACTKSIVSPGESYLTKELRNNNDVSALMLRVWTRELRT